MPPAPGLNFRWRLLRRLLWSVFAPAVAHAQIPVYDVIVYGGTSSGVMAAVQAAQMGKSVLLIEPGGHLGGMTASGLSYSDIGDPATVGGLTATFYGAIGGYYQSPAGTLESAAAAAPGAFDATAGVLSPLQWVFEPHVAADLFLAMLRRSGAHWVLRERLNRTSGVALDNHRIMSLTMEDGRRYAGRVFIDATYEGDLMAAAGVSWRIGRESIAEFGENLAGIFPDSGLTGEVDPYVSPGLSRSGLLPGVQAANPGEDGAADRRVQQYNLRLCLSNVPGERVAITQPANYNPPRYELLARYLQKHPDFVLGADILKFGSLPGGKVDANNTDSFSTDMAGDLSDQWTEASYARRAELFQMYRDYTQGMLWFLAHDNRVPAAIRAQAATWGLAADEFTDNGHWPWQLYVRESRRLSGRYTITEHDAEGEAIADDPVAMGSYGFDSHKVTLFVDRAGQLNTEGYFFQGVLPYPISYRALTPRREQCRNLLVSVCVSATHVAFNSLRMEPVYMMLGQAAGTAAGLAIDEGRDVQGIDYSALAARLTADGQILTPP
jgi:hypothetical protein